MAFPGMQGMGGGGADAGMSEHEKKTVQMVHNPSIMLLRDIY